MAARRGVLTLEPQVFLGMAGLGKTLLAKIVTHELGEHAEQMGQSRPRFFEWFPADIPNVERLDQLMQEVIDNPGCVVFIDEVHDLKESHNLKLYLVLEEGRYKMAGPMEPVQLPPFTMLAATTDWGAVHSALKRRWISHQLRPATEEQLLGYVMRRGFPIEDSAARSIVGRTKWSGAPWEALQLYRIAATTAEARGSATVEDADVERVFATQEIDRFGLRWQDRRIMEVLFTQPKYRMVKKEPVFVAYAASEQAVVTLAGIDRAEYRESVKPRLMSRGLLQVRATYGQSLTPRAEEWYKELRDAQIAAG